MPPKDIKKRPNRRSKQKYPALNPRFNLKTRTDLIDYDYLEKLSDKEKEWLNKFSEEYINASFDKKALHKTKALKKDCYDRNNSRNRDILTRSKASGQSLYLEDLEDTEEPESADELNKMVENVDERRKK